jgi:arsenite methyltransferase
MSALDAALVARYRQVAQSPRGHFPYPVGRASAAELGYTARALDDAPVAVVERFVGIGNPFRTVAPRPGERVLDVGCGAGLDTFVAAERVGPSGCAVGVDRTAAMVAVATAAGRPSGRQWPQFLVADAAHLPFANGAFDFVSSNGALNLVFDKAAAFAELARVLRPGGTLSVADVLIVESVPEAVLASLDAWST